MVKEGHPIGLVKHLKHPVIPKPPTFADLKLFILGLN